MRDTVKFLEDKYVCLRIVESIVTIFWNLKKYFPIIKILPKICFVVEVQVVALLVYRRSILQITDCIYLKKKRTGGGKQWTTLIIRINKEYIAKYFSVGTCLAYYFPILKYIRQDTTMQIRLTTAADIEAMAEARVRRSWCTCWEWKKGLI